MIHVIKIKPVSSIIVLNKIFIRTATTVNTVKPETNEQIKSLKDIPGPSSLPIIGQLHHFMPGGELESFTLLEGSKKAFNKYGPIFKFDGVFGRPHTIFLNNPESVATILRNENWMPVRPGLYSVEYYRKYYRKNKPQTVKATGLVSDHGEVWKDLRSTVNPVMLQPKTIQLYCKVLDEVALDMVARLKADRDEKYMIRRPFDMEINLWALESIGTVALGCRINCLDPNLPEDSPEKQLIECIHKLFDTGNEMDVKPSLWRYFSTPMYKRAMKLYEQLDELINYFVHKGMAQIENENTGNVNVDKSDNEKGVLEKLLAINEEVAIIMASDMLFAGVDTVSNTMTATLYLLATNLDKQEKLREEILSKSEKKLYLKACVKESLRLMPVIPGNFRLTTKEYDILGYRIPKDVHIVFPHQLMSLMEEQYTRPNEYIPERWICDKNDPLYYGNAHPFAHAPFGFGARSCIGRRIAELEIETFLERVIENFQLEWVGGPPKVEQISMNYIKGPFNFIFKDVKDANK